MTVKFLHISGRFANTSVFEGLYGYNSRPHRAVHKDFTRRIIFEFIKQYYSKPNPQINDGSTTSASPRANLPPNAAVISLDYFKAPNAKFPQLINELTDIVTSILEDDSLPFVRSKVAIGGFSAGGCCSLAVPQASSLQGKIQSVCAFYPVCGFVTPQFVSIAARPSYAPKDGLEHMSPLFKYAYIRPGTDLCDSRLGVTYVDRKMLPEKICMVGCELDMLWYDAEFMAERFVGRRGWRARPFGRRMG
ncbi:uncharacterized protein EAF01_005324 [Botrytis porri]|uniref:uncharacterized protein n=1 Tax=Botrytis porri TaxID=87229 RepID=UPI00190255EC|nr:uncharacterized protein EAF01_005324 [Botrytis porri]KAF7907738.1 hypothetical protein EAF01_005324 [Botrytis porri]